MSNFYINRLKTFSIAEFPYRIKQMMIKQLEQRVYQGKPVAALNNIISKQLLQPAFEKEVTLHDDEIHIFGKNFNYKNIQAADWHRDIFSGKSFPLSFAKSISIRQDPDLSAKCVWEINRMQFLMQVAIKYHQTKDAATLNQFISINQSWKESNPYLAGVNWYSNIEVNLRLINWFLCWEVIKADELMKDNNAFKTFVTNDWLPMIHQHCVYSYKNPSKYSSANNHLISEYAGLFVASVKWSFNESPKWISYSQQGLETEIIKQHSKNGVNKEEAAEYIQFITDFFLVAYVAGENSGHPFSKQYKEQLHQIFNYICSFLDCKGNFPKYGDEDDGKCFIVDFDHHFNNFKSILSSGAIIFNDPVLKAKSNGFDAKNQLLFGAAGKKAFEAVENKSIAEGSAFYTEEGHFYCRKKEGDKEVYFHFDAAPLGFLSIAAHGHADALSFFMHVDGQPVFVDPGTYTYHTAPEWRNYFVSTLAHNTIRVNKLNQADFAGSTLWLNHYKCTVLKAETTETTDTIKATHNGYEKQGVSHTREVVFDKVQLKITITDFIETKNTSCFIEVPFHLHPAISVQKNDEHNFTLINKNGRNVQLRTDQKLKAVLLNGQLHPEITGWYSNSFLHKEQTNTILCSLQFSGNIQLETIISIN
ncbi:alginate lyase family protein [Ferruginibacter sp. SUN106]|uniref:alginate lyase family protein n=1 Tax=Ferruginibacter sp. SUN106 TaxID=2978348 RepID=UPI003D3662AF